MPTTKIQIQNTKYSMQHKARTVEHIFIKDYFPGKC